LRLLAARDFHTIVAFQKKSGPATITTGWIPNKLDSGFQWLDSGFHKLDSGFQSRGFRIPQAKIAWIPDSGLPYMGRSQGAGLFRADNTLFLSIGHVSMLKLK